MYKKPINIDTLPGPELAQYVDVQLAEPIWRSLNDIAGDFVTDDGQPVERTALINRLKFAEPGVLIEYKSVGVLLRHRRIPELATTSD